MFIQLLNVGTGVMIARLLGPEGRGVLAAALLWPALLVTIGHCGFVEAVSYLTARRAKPFGEIAATGFALAAGESAVIITTGYFLMPLVLQHYGSEAVFAARLYLLWVPLTLLALTAAAILRGNLAFGQYNLVRASVIALTVAGLLLLLVLHKFSVIPVVIVYLAANLFTLLLGLSLLIRAGWFGVRPSLSLLRTMLAYGLKSHAGNISVLANERADQALISLILPPVYLGLYSVAVTVTAAVTLLGSSLSIVTLPAVGSARSVEQMRAIFARLLRATAYMSVLTAALVIVLAPGLITVFFGEAFVGSIDATRILLVAAVFTSVNLVLSAGLNALNKPLVPSVAQLLAAVVTVASLALLLPRYGILGAAIASCLAYATATAYLLRSTSRVVGLPLSAIVPARSDFKVLFDQGRQVLKQGRPA